MVQTAEPITYPARMNATQGAIYVGVSKPVMLRELAAGRVPARRIGKRWVLDKAALDRWLAGEQDGPRPAA